MPYLKQGKVDVLRSKMCEHSNQQTNILVILGRVHILDWLTKVKRIYEPSCLLLGKSLS